MSQDNHQHDWLSLIEISGPFLAVPVLKEAFPQGLEELDATRRKRLRQAYEEWREALELEDAQFPELHTAWIDEVLSRGLELDEDGKGDVLKRAKWCAANLQASLPEHGVTLSPDFAVIDEQRANKPLLLIQTYAQDVDLETTLKQDGWVATSADRMVQMCRSLDCRLGLVTNGERWMLVDAPAGAVSTFASWYARIWNQEPITLQAFVHLLGIRRFFVDESEQLPALFDRSLKFQDEVTDALGEQVRRAVEVLIQTLDKADQDRNRELLHDVREPELYEAALTVMMRLVFLLSAEERGLLLMGDERYEANYALSTLRMQLRKESEEILEHRWDAWSRLLAIFRAVFGGIEHEILRLPALGGSLFDPDRFPFLEGRAKGSNWRNDPTKPLPIDNRTVLLLLDAIQQFQGRALSYRALDVEQIGYVYEGLLERTVRRTDEVTLALAATKNAKLPWVKLAELDSACLDGAARLAELLQERSGSSPGRVRNDLAKPVDNTLADRLLTACQGDTKLRDRVKPYAHLLRTDPWGYPLVYPAGAFIVTIGSDRRETGTHYTPKSLTEAIVADTLTPVAYAGPAEGTPLEQWTLKSPAELLDLKICDPAMGSGAFLVQACRWLSERLVEAWSQVEATGKTVSVDGEVLDAGVSKEPLPRESEARIVIARRLIAERCLYGVDLNPLAVELAKLSIWLVTLAKDRPFGFLDHNLRCGDSLLGIHRLDQLTELSMTPGQKGERAGHLFGQNIEKAVLDAIELRQRLREMPIHDIHDVEAMARLDAESRRRLEVPERIADAFIGEVLTSGGNAAALENSLASLVILAGQAADGSLNAFDSMNRGAAIKLSADLPPEKFKRKPFHWPLEFPEVFVRKNSGFNAFVGNPPFLRGHDISGTAGQRYREYIATYVVGGNSGIADLCAYFVRRVSNLVCVKSCSGFIATNSISEGDSKSISLAYLLENKFHVISAAPNLVWPGKASVVISPFVVFNGEWRGVCRLHEEECGPINSSLSTIDGLSTNSLQENTAKAFVGCYVLGNGFEFSPDLAAQLIVENERNRDVLLPYLNGIELNGFPSPNPKRTIACFWDWSLQKASTYSEVFDVIKQNFSAGQDKDKWWLYARSRPDLYHRIGLGERFSKHPKDWVSGGRNLSSVIVKAKTSNTWGFEIYPTQVIFDQAITVIASDHLGLFATLQSTIHETWARYSGAGSAMKTDLRYAPTLFETFPFPTSLEELSNLGRRYHQKRAEIMKSLNIGLTKLYNGFHDPNSIMCFTVDVLRDLHKELDIAVVHSYGWADIDLEHDFYDVQGLPENDRVRFTISETARIEILRRLSELNRQRHEEETEASQHRGNALRTPLRAKRGSRVSSTESVQPSLDFDATPPTDLDANGSVSEVLDYLRSNGSWLAKADIVAAARVSDGSWKSVIEGLIASGKVERRGEKRGARYRAIGIGG